MIPVRTREIVGTQSPTRTFEPHAPYALEGFNLSELEVLMRRLGTQQRMDGEEMRDWMNRLGVMLDAVEPLA